MFGTWNLQGARSQGMGLIPVQCFQRFTGAGPELFEGWEGEK